MLTKLFGIVILISGSASAFALPSFGPVPGEYIFPYYVEGCGPTESQPKCRQPPKDLILEDLKTYQQFKAARVQYFQSLSQVYLDPAAEPWESMLGYWEDVENPTSKMYIERYTVYTKNQVFMTQFGSYWSEPSHGYYTCTKTVCAINGEIVLVLDGNGNIIKKAYSNRYSTFRRVQGNPSCSNSEQIK